MSRKKTLPSHASKNRDLRDNIDKLTMESEKLEQQNRVLGSELQRYKTDYEEAETQLAEATNKTQILQLAKQDLEKINKGMQKDIAQSKLMKEGLIKKVEVLYRNNNSVDSKKDKKSGGIRDLLGALGGHGNPISRSNSRNSRKGSGVNAHSAKENDAAIKQKDKEIRNLRLERDKLRQEKLELNDKYNKEIDHFNTRNDDLEAKNASLQRELNELKPVAQPRQSQQNLSAWFSIDSSKLQMPIYNSTSGDSGLASPNNNRTRSNFRRTVRQKLEKLDFQEVYGELDGNDKTFRIYKNDDRVDIYGYYHMKYVFHVKEVTGFGVCHQRIGVNLMRQI